MIGKITVVGTVIAFLVFLVFIFSLFGAEDRADVVREMRAAFLDADRSCSIDDDCIMVSICDYTCERDCKYVNRNSGIVKRLEELRIDYEKASGNLCRCECTCGELDIPRCVNGTCTDEFWPFTMVKPDGCETP
jgi:hypothetical protein